MDSPVLHIDLAVPQGWHELSDKQLRYAFELIASNYTSNEIKTLCLFRQPQRSTLPYRVIDHLE